MSGRNPPSYCTLTLIAIQGHQQKGRQTNTSSNNKDKSDTIIETSTAEDHDDDNLHNASTRPRYSPGSRRRAVGDHTRTQPYPVIYVVANPVRGHKEVPRSTGHIMVTTRYSDQQGSKSRQKVMRLYKRWHRPITNG